MVLYIGSKSYIDNSSMSEQLIAIKNLPSPLPGVRKDFDEGVYNMEPEILVMKSLEKMELFLLYTGNGTMRRYIE